MVMQTLMLGKMLRMMMRLPRKESCALQASNKPVRKMFSDEQVACLRDHYKRGMIGVGRKYNSLIQSASEETGLKLTQVKVS